MTTLMRRMTWPISILTLLILCVIVQSVSASLCPLVTQTGKISWSIDGLGIYPAKTGLIQVEKPAGATVRSAYLAASTTCHSLNQGDIKIDNADFVWTTRVAGQKKYGIHNYWGDVTSLVKTTIDAAPAGRINLTITEAAPLGTNGELLVVIFDDPAQKNNNSIVLLFGAQASTGDDFTINLAEPINVSDPDVALDLSLGIAFSSQGFRSEQGSIVDVNGQRVTSWAGGSDDAAGSPTSGNLFTVGGLDDNTTDPADPYAQPSGDTRYDDELYALLPFVRTGDTQITVHTQNQTSFSDHNDLLFAGVFLHAATAESPARSIVLSPANATGSAGATHTLTATAQDVNCTAIVGRSVTFNVTSGPNAGQTGSATTGADGKAQFTYSGTSAGTDTIRASFCDGYGHIISSKEAVMIWTPKPAIKADFSSFGHVGQAPYSVWFEDLSSGFPTAWMWDFGDGATSIEQNTTHIYNQTGVYNVTLTASNDQTSDTAVHYSSIIVNSAPEVAFTASATAGRTPLTVQFMDQSRSTGAPAYQWQFGDGTNSTERNPVHIYTQPGSYTVILTVSAPEYGSVSTQKAGYITVSDPPAVGLSANVTAGQAPLLVEFNALPDDPNLIFHWNWGDLGNGPDPFSGGANTTYLYVMPGTYTVTLDTGGLTLERYNLNIIVTPGVLNADFQITTTPGSDLVKISDTSTNAATVRYDLGDGSSIQNTTAHGPVLSHHYVTAGTYTITQIAISTTGEDAIKQIPVTVGDAPTTIAITPTVTPGFPVPEFTLTTQSPMGPSITGTSANMTSVTARSLPI